MPDWRALVGEHLARLDMGAERYEEVRTELAEHMEDAYHHALERGMSREEAMAFASKQVPDWQHLAQNLRSVREEKEMTNTAKTIWVPGTAILLFSMMVLLVLTRVVPPHLWLQGNSPVVLYSIWMLSYVGLGAMGAYWSRRAGGEASARYASGVFPLGMHLAAFGMAIIAGAAGTGSGFPENRYIAELLKLVAVWIALPAVMLSIGTLPFLRKGRA